MEDTCCGGMLLVSTQAVMFEPDSVTDNEAAAMSDGFIIPMDSIRSILITATKIRSDDDEALIAVKYC